MTQLQIETLSVIAHYEMALGIERDVPGFPGFAKAYVGSLPPSDAAVVVRYDDLKHQAHQDLAEMMQIKDESA